ncbi:MAG: vWA domain-containing protein, partial [Gemmataceae bacterium]
LLLQLLAIFALIYAALGPRLHGSLASGRHYILMIDNSASMSATDVEPNRLTWAKAEALKEIEAATDSDFGMVIAFNSTAEIRQSYTNNRAELKNAVAGIEASTKPTHIDEALSLAASLANPQNSTENAAAAPANPEPGKERTYVPTEGMQADVHLYSDGRFPTPDFALANLVMNYHVPPANTPDGTSDNLSISRIDAERGFLDLGLPADEVDPRDPVLTRDDARKDDTSKLTVFASVRNYRAGVAEMKLTLELYEAGKSEPLRAYAKTLKAVPPKSQLKERDRLVPFYVPDVPENEDMVFRLRIENAKDALPQDDEAWLVLGIVRKSKILLVTPDNNFLLRNFFDLASTKRYAEVTYRTPADLTAADKYLSPAREGKYDCVIFDRCAPPSED